MKEERFPYEDILHRSRPISEKHPPMDRAKRAAQFMPFAALTGYEDSIREAARLTGARIELDEGEKEKLDAKLAFLLQITGERKIRVTYFEPDPLKEGGLLCDSGRGLSKAGSGQKYAAVGWTEGDPFF